MPHAFAGENKPSSSALTLSNGPAATRISRECERAPRVYDADRPQEMAPEQYPATAGEQYAGGVAQGCPEQETDAD